MIRKMVRAPVSIRRIVHNHSLLLLFLTTVVARQLLKEVVIVAGVLLTSWRIVAALVIGVTEVRGD